MAPLALVALLAPLAPDAAGQNREIVDTFVDGSIRTRYAIDSAGRRTGTLVRYYRNGKVRLRATYSRGQRQGQSHEYYASGLRKRSSSYRDHRLHGRDTQYSPDGKRVVTAQFEKGTKHGDFAVVVDGKTLTRQVWSLGELVLLDRFAPFPRRKAAIRSELTRILRPPEAIDGIEKDPQLPRRLAALRRLQAYRYLCGLPYEAMYLDPEFNELCDYGARLCRRIGRLEHTPTRPPGMDAESYRKGYEATSHSNLSAGSGMVRSVDAYMFDSDEKNIAGVGHRRWCLNPTMLKTGFGAAGKYSAMWSFDTSGESPAGLAAVFYPPRGYVPVDYFGPDHAWSISILRGGPAKQENLRIEITPLDEFYLPAGRALELDFLAVTSSGPGIKNCVIFRPSGLVSQPGRRYLCEVSLDRGRTVRYRYVVEFI